MSLDEEKMTAPFMSVAADTGRSKEQVDEHSLIQADAKSNDAAYLI
ncbi:MAG: hypothetical protein ACOX55_04540 [Christensenellales bacterium]